MTFTRSLAAGAGLFLLAAAPLPPSALAVKSDGTWRTWWRSDAAPARWSGPSDALVRAVVWQPGADGVEWAEVLLAGSGEAWRTRVIVARLDPARLELALDTGLTPGVRATWTAARAPDDAVFAVNAGQFATTMPWGWVVLEGREFLPSGAGPLVTTLSVDDAGSARWNHGGTVPIDRANTRWAFQSYPTLLRDGVVPVELQSSGRGIDVAHRDARAAIGRLPDGRVLVAITRFDALGGSLSFVPFGLTTPEMAAVMGALGARDAVLLDGGISAQMTLRDAAGAKKTWPGMRAVPVALVARAKPEARPQ